MLKIQDNVPLAKYSTFGVGGMADHLVIVYSRQELEQALSFSKVNNILFTILGSGSNVLIHDSGFRGLVIVNKLSNYVIKGHRLVADSGANFGKVARDTLSAGLIGLHFGAGIPGSIGGAIVGNAGALDCDISKCLASADIWHDGKIETWQRNDFQFAYRYSKLKGLPNYVILSATFELEKGETGDIIKQVQDDVLRRGSRYIGKTCGSYFKNPEGKTAGELIDTLGLKGHRVGGAEVSPFHANVIRNVAEAKAIDILELEKYIQNKVYEKYKISLEPEVVKIGF